VHLAEGYARAQSIAVKKKHGQSTDLMIVLNEGRNREIRRILARVGHKVLTLKRIAVGPIKLGDLPLGAWRKLLPSEVESLLQVAKEKRRERKRQRESATPTRRASEGSTAAIQARSASEGPRDEGRYLQKQALFAEPLSLDDLLRDDMEEGPLGGPLPDRGATDHEPVEGGQGGVIDYEDDAPPIAPPPRPQRPVHHGKPPGGKRPPGKPFRAKHRAGEQRPEQRERSADRDQLPREDFGRKRGGKRALGPTHEARGLAGKTADNFRFRKKTGKKAAQPHPAKARRGAASVQQKFAGKKTGTPGKKFGKPGGKPGGKRKGRRG
jgi:hypothetical protein